MAYQFTQTGQELQYLIDRIYQIADEYDSSASYAVGDYCSYQGHIYRCTAATTGTFDASAWTDSIFVMDTIKALDTRLTTAEGDISALNTSLAPSSGTVTGSSYVTINRQECYKILGFCVLNLTMTASSAIPAAATVIATLPSGFAPAIQYTTLMQAGSSSVIGAINSVGQVVCYQAVASGQGNITLHAVFKVQS